MRHLREVPEQNAESRQPARLPARRAAQWGEGASACTASGVWGKLLLTMRKHLMVLRGWRLLPAKLESPTACLCLSRFSTLADACTSRLERRNKKVHPDLSH